MDDDREEWRRAVEAAGILRRDAPFSTEELWEHMRWYWSPVLDEEITFTPELAAEMVRRNTQTTGLGGRINQHCNVPEGTIFLTRINFGLSGLLGKPRRARAVEGHHSRVHRRRAAVYGARAASRRQRRAGRRCEL